MNKQDTYQDVTNAIVAQLEAGTKPWRPGWTASGKPCTFMGALPRRANGETYRGINVLLLWMAADERGYSADRWMTFKQAIDLGGAVRKGEKGTRIVFFKKLDVTATNAETGAEEAAQVPMMRGYTVFNVEQIDGLPADYLPAPFVPNTLERDSDAEAALRSSGAIINERGGSAFYSPSTDQVTMPAFDRFHTVGDYLTTLAHELCHWTGHKSRLDRGEGMRSRFGSNAYAFEELVAEIGAAFIGARLGIAGEHLDNHAAYLAGWLKVLEGDKRAIFKAATLAQAAADLVLANAGTETTPAPAPAPTEAASAPEPAPQPANAAQLVALRAASPMRPAYTGQTAAALPLFDSATQPALL